MVLPPAWIVYVLVPCMSLPLLVMVNTAWPASHFPLADRLDLSQLGVLVRLGVAV